MKILSTLLLVLALGFTAHAEDAKKAAWPALKAFHTVMAQTFHPSEEGNLKPVRTRATELVEKADALSKGAVPKDYNSPEMQDAVKRLQAGTREVKKMVDDNATDEELKDRMVGLHDNFHEIMGLCSKGEGHEEESHKGHSH
jgi:hypothetical protein